MAFHSSVLELLVTANVVPSPLIPVTLMTELICFSETSALTIATQRNIPEDEEWCLLGCYAVWLL
jgi:hypothetical protein